MSTPSLRFHVLVDWLEGRLAPAAAEEVARAVAVADETTQETVAWITEFLDAAAGMPLVAPPPEVSRRLRDVFDDLHAPSYAGEWSEADLRHDSRATGTAGFRSGTTSEVSHLIFHGPLADVLLEVARRDRNSLDLGGQLQRTDSRVPLAGAEVTAMRDGELARAARTDSDGRFAFTALPADVDELWITHDGSRMRLRPDLTDQP